MRIASSVRIVSACALFAVASASQAAIVNDNFDSYANQAAFESVWTPIGSAAPLSGELSVAQASSPTQSIRNPAAAVNSTSRNRLTFPESGTIPLGQAISFSLDFYDSTPAGAPARNYVNLQDTTAPSGTNQLIALGFNNNQSNAQSGGAYYMARILGYSPLAADPDGGPGETGTLGSGAFFKLNDFIAPNRTLGWHNLKVEMSSDDGLSTDYKFYVDGILAERIDNVGTLASMRSFDNIALGSGLSNASTEVFFDNVKLEIVPEPSSLALATLALGLGRRRSRA